MTSAKSNWLLINVLYIVSRDDLGRIGWNLRNRHIVLLIFWVIFFICSTKFSLTSNVNPRCFWDKLFFKEMSLNERQGWSSFLVFLPNITSCTWLVMSGFKIIFHWKAQLPITDRSLCVCCCCCCCVYVCVCGYILPQWRLVPSAKFPRHTWGCGSMILCCEY